MSLKIATWNVNSLKVRLPQVLEWLDKVKPDVLALQETKVPDVDFPLAAINEAGYQAIYSGQRTYNGVAILSRVSSANIITDIAGLEDPQRRVLAATFDDLRVINLYVPNGESVVSAKYAYKLDWLNKLQFWLEQEIKMYPKLVVLGDFNIAPEDRDVHDPQAWAGQVLFSDKERAALRSICELGFQDCFRLKPQPEASFSWWDYRMNGFKRNRGLRIDHILASNELSSRCTHTYIDKGPRASERPSDHAPVVAEFST